MLLALLSISMPVDTMAQKQANFWYFGKNAALDFTNFDPIPLSNSQMDAPKGVASISDSTGQLLFYTDGRDIWNSLHEKVNTTGLSGDPQSTQSATIVPDPDTLDQFFVFTTRIFNSTSEDNFGGNFYKIRITAGAPGTILYDYSAATGKKGLGNSLTEKFCAVPFTRPDGKVGYWFLMHEFNTARFLVFKYDGVLSEPSWQVVGSAHVNDSLDDGNNRGAAGQMKVNDQGNFLALAVEGGKFFELFRFNLTSGQLTFLANIPTGDQSNRFQKLYGAYGVEFSPTLVNSYDSPYDNFLYGSTSTGGVIYRWSLSNPNDAFQLVKNGEILAVNPSMQCGSLQIAPNGKIYVAFEGQDYLGVIKKPNTVIADSVYESNGVRLVDNETNLGGASALGLPATVPLPRKAEAFYFENLCLGDITKFYISNQNGITTSVLVVSKIGGGKTVNLAPRNNQFHYKFTTAGNYKAILSVIRSGKTSTYSRYFTINPIPEVSLVEGNYKDTVMLCKGSVLNLDAGYGAFYEWEDESIKDRKRTVTTDGNFYNMYRVKVKDYHGCIGWDTIVVRREIPPTATHTSVSAFCARHDGSATVVPNGNISSFTYSWEGYPDEKTNTLSGINGGDYVVHVTRISTGCEVIDTIKVEELGGSSVKIKSNLGPVVCPGVPVTLTVEGAAELQWISHPELSGNEVTLTLDTTTVIVINAISRNAERECTTVVTDTIWVHGKNIPDLGPDRTSCAGWTVEVDGGEDYTEWNWSNGQSGRIARVYENTDALVLSATDNNGCVFTDAVGVHFMPSPNVNLGRDTAVCSKDPIILRGGTGESYLWSTNETTREIAVSETGDYILSITKDGCSLADTIHVQLNDPRMLEIDSVSYQDITCFGAANGSIRVYAKGDGRDFYYSIDNGLNYSYNDGIFENVGPGSNFLVKVLEDSVCTQAYPQPIQISQPDTLKVNYCSLPPSCKNCTDGVITVAQITGGTPPYQITLNGEVRDSIIGELGLGTYVLTVTDSQLCEATHTIVMTEGTRPEVLSSINQPVCSGTQVSLAVTNSQRAEWLNPAGNNNLEIVVQPFETTTYRVRSINTSTDNFVCEMILEYTVEIIPFIKPEIGEDVRACEGDTIKLDGGDYISWSWSNSMNDRNITLYTSVDPLILSVVDASGCLLRDTISVRFSPHPVADLGEDRSECTAAPVILSGGTGDSYLWSTGAISPELPVIKTDWYSLKITTGTCSSTDSVYVRVLNPDLLTIQEVNTTDNTCFGGEAGSIEIIVQGSGSSYQYSIDDGVTYQPENVFDNLPAGSTFKIWVTEDSLCYKDYDLPVSIAQPDSMNISYRLKSPTCETCSDGRLILDISGGTPPYQIVLSGVPIGLTTETLSIGSYVIVVTDANLCTQIVEFKLELLNEVPNVITTNNDGINDRWKIPMLKYYPDAVVKVFTSAGKLVFESQPGYPLAWDGRDNGNPLPMGTYYYLISLGPGEQRLTGYLTILR